MRAAGRSVGAADAEGLVVGGLVATGLEIEAPAVEGADEVAPVDLAERREVGVAMWASSLDDVVADADVGLVQRSELVDRGELSDHLGLGPTHPLARQRLQEVVDVLVELALPPRRETARQQQRVAPVDGALGDHGFDELARDVEPERVLLAVVHGAPIRWGSR